MKTIHYVQVGIGALLAASTSAAHADPEHGPLYSAITAACTAVLVVLAALHTEPPKPKDPGAP